MAKKRTPEELQDWCQEETTIECSVKGCENGSTDNSSAEYAVDEFFAQGWRSTGANVYCPACAVKYLKHI